MTTIVHIKNDESSKHDIKTSGGNVIKPGEKLSVYVYHGGDLTITEVPLDVPHST